MKCPICKKDVAADGEFFPFCSERCKIIDLGNWASEKYVISTPIQPTESDDSAKTMSLSPLPRGRWDAAFMLATWFGCGYAPMAPGTAGSLAALVIAIADPRRLRLGPRHVSRAGRAAARAGHLGGGRGREARSDIEDPGIVVVDEVIGQWITLAGASTLNWKSCLAAFVLFRALDIWKPPPARQFERFPGGYGIVADDVMAGVYGALAIFVLDRLHLF